MKKRDTDGEKIGFRERLRYGFDNLMSRGTVSMVAVLFGITAVVVIAAGLLVAILGCREDLTVVDSIWISLMHAIDAGTLTADRESFPFMLLMTLVTICGLFITSVLFGIVSTGMLNKMESLRKGKSKVLEQDHTIILGFNRNVYVLLRELIEANANQPSGVVVVMDDSLEKEEMETAIHLRFPDPGNTRIICRHGGITDLDDLFVCTPEKARSIIINCEDDFLTIKAILAVTTLMKKAKGSKAFVTAVIHDKENYEAAQIAGESQVEILFFDDTIARIVAQASRQPGLSQIYTELFRYEGDEIYVEDIPQARGRRMKELNLLFPSSTVMGIVKKDRILMNPDGETMVDNGDRLVILAEDDGVSVPQANPGTVNHSAINESVGNTPEQPQKMLILGYGPRLSQVLLEEDQAMAPGSEVLLCVQEEYEKDLKALEKPRLENIGLRVEFGDLYHKAKLRELLDWEPDSILVLNSLQEDAQADDSRTLMMLLQLRAIGREQNVRHPVTSEMRDVANQELAQITEVRDFVISSNITSLMVSHISQCRELNEIFTGLLTDAGSEIYMRPASDYVQTGRTVNFYTAAAAAAHKHQVFLGYRRMDPETQQLEVCLNPDKALEMRFRASDSFVVLAED